MVGKQAPICLCSLGKWVRRKNDDRRRNGAGKASPKTSQAMAFGSIPFIPFWLNSHPQAAEKIMRFRNAAAP
jgi:hypothetical protein